MECPYIRGTWADIIGAHDYSCVHPDYFGAEIVASAAQIRRYWRELESGISVKHPLGTIPVYGCPLPKDLT